MHLLDKASQIQIVPHHFLTKACNAVTYLGCAENTLWKSHGWEQQILPIRNYASPPGLSPDLFIANKPVAQFGIRAMPITVCLCLGLQISTARGGEA